MRASKFLFLIFSLLFFTGCATTGKYETKLSSWVGEPVAKLFDRWGIPDAQIDLPEGGKVYTYVESGSPYSTLSGGYVMTSQSWCKTSFTADQNQVITSWSWKGNACTST